MCVICRSKFHEYPEYHTSKDDLSLISPEGLEGGFEVYRKCIDALEWNELYQINCICEPQLSNRGLYPYVSKRGSSNVASILLDFIAYADGKNSLIEISNIIGVSIEELIPIIKQLLENNLISIIQEE